MGNVLATDFLVVEVRAKGVLETVSGFSTEMNSNVDDLNYKVYQRTRPLSNFLLLHVWIIQQYIA